MIPLKDIHVGGIGVGVSDKLDRVHLEKKMAEEGKKKKKPPPLNRDAVGSTASEPAPQESDHLPTTLGPIE